MTRMEAAHLLLQTRSGWPPPVHKKPTRNPIFCTHSVGALTLRPRPRTRMFRWTSLHQPSQWSYTEQQVIWLTGLSPLPLVLTGLVPMESYPCHSLLMITIFPSIKCRFFYPVKGYFSSRHLTIIYHLSWWLLEMMNVAWHALRCLTITVCIIYHTGFEIILWWMKIKHCPLILMIPLKLSIFLMEKLMK